MTVGRGLYGLPELKLPPRPPSRFSTLFKVILWLGVIVFLSLSTLHFVGGNSEKLKTTLEKYISDSTGYKATIGTLNAVSFYPLIGIDMNDVTLTKSTLGEVARFSHINFSTSFWGASSGSSIHTLDIRDSTIMAGIYMPGKIDIEHFFIDVKDPKAPKLSFIGAYGGKKVTIVTDLKRTVGLFGSSYFGLANPASLHIEAGPVQAQGTILTDIAGRRIEIDHFEAGKNLKPLKMTIALFSTFDGMNAKGKIDLAASAIDYDLAFEHQNNLRIIKGNINADRLDLDDLSKEGGLLDDYDVITDLYRAGAKAEESAYNFNQLALNVDIKVDHLLKAGVDLGKVSTVAQTKDDIFNLDPITGSIKDGDLNGKISLDAKQIPASLSADITIKKADYTSMTSMVAAADETRGRADVKINLASKGNNGDQLWTNLNGKATIIAGPGGLKTPLINLWGGGLLNTMLPKFKRTDPLKLNCGIGDFQIEQGEAKTKTLFLDTDHVTVVGEGSINLARSTIHMKLEPKTKDTAFFSAASAVQVSGNLEHPRIEPDMFSLGKKLGGLFLGTINPVYLAFSLTDLGESNNHPCRAYIKQ